MAQTPHPAPPSPPQPPQQQPKPPSPSPNPNPGPESPAAPKAATPEPKPGEDEKMKLERDAIKAALENKDFKLGKVGTRDYVAGQPVDEKELSEVTAEAKKRLEAGQNAKQAGGSTHRKFVQQYGPEGQEAV